MHMTEFPFCCTAKVVVGFEQSLTAEPDKRLWNYVEPSSVEVIAKFLVDTIESERGRGHALLTITTNSDQERANKALRKLGFSHSHWMSKPQHTTKKLRLWWVDVQTWAMPKQVATVTPKRNWATVKEVMVGATYVGKGLLPMKWYIVLAIKEDYLVVHTRDGRAIASKKDVVGTVSI